MCFQPTAIRPYQKWNWAGNEIIHEPAFMVQRKLTRKGQSLNRYKADIREFLSIEKNAVIRGLIEKLLKQLPPDEQLRFYNNAPGNRDCRVKYCQYYLRNFSYQLSKGGFDEWQYPEETVVLKTGDCEDYAFLLASMLEACDISPYCIRVAFGKIVDHASGATWDHAWVMYQNEMGSWEIIEPAQYLKHAKPATSAKKKYSRTQDVEYLPHFVFNRDHVWRVRSNESEVRLGFESYLKTRNYFSKFHPAFAASVHGSIFDEALKGIPWLTMQRIKVVSLNVDVNTAAYDPRDHFDFAYIDESWAIVQQRLASGTLKDFALAAHAIADFYAHSVYGYFMLDPTTKKLPVYDPAAPQPPPDQIQYDFSNLGERPGCKSNTATASTYWTNRKKIISGQWYRWFASIPNVLQNNADFAMRRCLPDHDALAVDSPTYNPDKHKLFTSKREYDEQFIARKAAAIAHIKKAYASGNYDW